MARRKISTTVYITEEQNELLKRLHDETKVPIAEYVRQGIDIILERHRLAGQPERQLSFEALFGRRHP
jgi:hypothetical protein